MVLGQDESIEMKINGIGETMWEGVGPTWPKHLAAWAMPVSSSIALPSRRSLIP
jgi:hypothetical protein